MVSVNLNLFKKDKLKRKIPSILLGIFSIGLISSSFVGFSGYQMKVKSVYHAPPKYIEHMTAGYSEILGDMLWIRVIQDFDYCESQVAENVCRGQSWLYKMLDSVTSLSPHFRMPFAVGGIALSVLITDVEGATLIFEKGVKAFPNDWKILYRAAYHHLYETHDKKRAAELLIRAGKNGAPSWVFTLAGRLYSDNGNLDLAESLLQQMIDDKQDETLIQRLRDKIDKIKSQKNSGSKPK